MVCRRFIHVYLCVLSSLYPCISMLSYLFRGPLLRGPPNNSCGPWASSRKTNGWLETRLAQMTLKLLLNSLSVLITHINCCGPWSSSRPRRCTRSCPPQRGNHRGEMAKTGNDQNGQAELETAKTAKTATGTAKP